MFDFVSVLAVFYGGSDCGRLPQPLSYFAQRRVLQVSASYRAPREAALPRWSHHALALVFYRRCTVGWTLRKYTQAELHTLRFLVTNRSRITAVWPGRRSLPRTLSSSCVERHARCYPRPRCWPAEGSTDNLPLRRSHRPSLFGSGEDHSTDAVSERPPAREGVEKVGFRNRRCRTGAPGTHRHGGVCPWPLGQLRLPVDVNGIHWVQRAFTDETIIEEAGKLRWPHQEFELMPLSIKKVLKQTMVVLTSMYIVYFPL